MSLRQEPKYDFQNGQVINRASGEVIPDDEPVFVFRARDKKAAMALAHYAGLCGDTDHGRTVLRRMNAFVGFAIENPERMKEPDTAPSQEGES